ncbi:UNVERIFIED_CONTAM: Obscn [Trichonephila clavipes]
MPINLKEEDSSLRAIRICCRKSNPLNTGFSSNIRKINLRRSSYLHSTQTQLTMSKIHKNPEGPELAKLAKLVAKSPTWSPKMTPSWLCQDFAKFPLNHHYNKDIDLTDKDLEKAAAKIQSTYRNFTARKKQVDPSSDPPKQEEPTENLDDIDLKDPDVEKAALKIQSTFRGYKTRKEIKPDEKPVENGEKGDDEE